MLPDIYNYINAEEIYEEVENASSSELPLLREYFFDFKKGSLVYENGRPKVVSGLDALRVYVYKALITKRFKYLGYSWDYGNELDSLIGKIMSKSVIEAEGKRLLEECLLVNPYITSVGKVKVDISGKKISINAAINTVYGEVEIDV